MQSKEHQEVQDELFRVIGRRYRTGALLLTCEPLPGVEAVNGGEPCTRILSAVGMREATLDAAMDLIQLIKQLRALADQLEAKLQLTKP